MAPSLSLSGSSQRLAGLDTLRALAVLAVMFFHLGGHLPPAWYPASRYGWAGVDLFFVLSGYLIGSQLLRPLHRGESLSLLAFYRQRAYRILPAYLAVLALYYLWPTWQEGNGLSPLWEFLTFTENLFIRYPAQNTFSHSWSLCVEEHFYLLLPGLVLLLSRRASAWKTVAMLLVVLVGGIALRYFFLVHTLRPLAGQRLPFAVAYVKTIYYPTYSHLDGLLVGVALALLQVFRPARWHALTRHPNLLLLGGSLLTAFSLYLFRDRFASASGAAAVSAVIGFPLLSGGLALLVAAAARPGSWLSRPLPGARWLATIAFSLYLTHKEVGNVLYHYAAPYMEAEPGPASLLLLALCLLVSSGLYLGIERPFLRLRDRRRQPTSSPDLVAQREPGL